MFTPGFILRQVRSLNALALGAILVLGVFFAQPASASQVQPRTIGNTPSRDWPSYVAFNDSETSLWNRCAGTLVHPRFVLTTASRCMNDRLPSTVAYVGATRSDPYSGQEVGIDQVFLHPRFSSGDDLWSVSSSWDAALVRLDRPVFGVRLPKLGRRTPKPGQRFGTVGLGNNYDAASREYSFDLLQAEVGVVSNRVCARYLGEIVLGESFFCASALEGPCMLDEGTGAFRNNTLIGVFTLLWGQSSQPPCPESYSAATYTPVSVLRPWIKSVTNRGYDPARFLQHGAIVFPNGTVNVYAWANQEIREPRVRFHETVCVEDGSHCYPARRWIRLFEPMSAGSKKSNYWVFKEFLRLPGKQKCLSGKISGSFEYPHQRATLTKTFRGCKPKR